MSRGAQDIRDSLQDGQGVAVYDKHLAKVLRNAVESSDKYSNVEFNYQILVSAVTAIADMLDKG